MTHTLSHIWPQDPWGRVLNGAVQHSELPMNVLLLCESAVDLAHERFGKDLHSVYLTGPVARNHGTEPEFLVVLRSARRTLGVDLFCAAAALRLQKEHEDFSGCRFHVDTWDDVFPSNGRFSHSRFRLAVNSIAIAGRDLKRLIAPQRLTAAVSNAHIIDLDTRLAGYVRRLKAISSESRVHSASRLFAKSCIDTAFALVMLDEQIYTEDPETMVSFVGLRYPEHRLSLADLVRLQRMGTMSSLEALSRAEAVLTWLPDLANAWLDMHNPERDRSLRLV